MRLCYCNVFFHTMNILLAVIPGPLSPADTVNPRFTGLTVFFPLIVRLAPHTEPVPRCVVVN